MTLPRRGCRKITAAMKTASWSLTSLPGWLRQHLAVVVTLSVSAAANVAVFAIGGHVLYGGPPFLPDLPRLKEVKVFSPSAQAGLVSLTEIDEIQSRRLAHASWAAYLRQTGSIRVGTETRRVSLTLISDSYFQTLGAVPIRGLVPVAAHADGGPVAVVTEALTDAFGDAIAVGRSVAVNGVSTTVIGVMPRGFRGTDPRGSEIWIPLRYAGELLHTGERGLDLKGDLNLRWFSLVARLRAGATEDQAGLELLGSSAATHRVEFRAPSLFLEGDGRAVAFIAASFQAGTILLAIIGVVNAASLTFARHLANYRNYAIQVALGCGRRQMMTALLLDALRVAAATFVFVVPLSVCFLYGVVKYATPEIARPLFENVDLLNWTVLGAAAALCVLTSLLASFGPAVRISRLAFKDSIRSLTSASDMAPGGASRYFVVVQTAMAVALLIVVGLLLQGRRSVLNTPAGFAHLDLWFGKIEPQDVGYTGQRTMSLLPQLFEALRSDPLLREVTLSRQSPLQSNGWANEVRIDGASSPWERAGFNAVWPNYLRTLSIQLVRGRDFTVSDTAAAMPVVIINQTLARLWANRDPVGSQLLLRGEDSPRTVVGVARDAKYTGLSHATRPYMYLPMTQRFPLPEQEVTIVVRPLVQPAQAEAAIRRALHSVDPRLALFAFGSVEGQIDREVAVSTFLARLFSITGVCALVLVCFGLQASLLRTLTLTRKEFALRLALGETHRGLQAMVVRRILRSMAIGIFIGWGLGAAASLSIRGVFPGGSVSDPQLIALVLASVLCCATFGAGVQLWSISRLNLRDALQQN